MQAESFDNLVKPAGPGYTTLEDIPERIGVPLRSILSTYYKLYGGAFSDTTSGNRRVHHLTARAMMNEAFDAGLHIGYASGVEDGKQIGKYEN